jgi:hypothetical protein
MAYREVFFGFGAHTSRGAVVDAAFALAGELRSALHVPQLYVRVLDDAGTRAAGVRWWWLAAPAAFAPHGAELALDDVDDALRASHPNALAIAHDDARGSYRFHARNARLVGQHAVARGLRATIPGASADAWSYLQLVGGRGLTVRIHDRARALDGGELVIAPPPLAGWVAPEREHAAHMFV